MKLGIERKGLDTMYPSATKTDDDKPEIIHKIVSLPLKILNGVKVKKGDRICIKLEGEITGIHDDEFESSFHMKAEEGECLDNDKDGDKENGTFLGGEEKD